jgi:hypothetical protein
MANGSLVGTLFLSLTGNCSKMAKGGSSLNRDHGLESPLRVLHIKANGTRFIAFRSTCCRKMSSGRSSPVLPRDRQTSDAGLIETPPSSSESRQPWKHFNVEQNSEPRNFLSRIVSGIGQADATERYDLEGADNKVQSPNSSVSSVSLPRKIISWKDGDPENPYNWPTVFPYCPDLKDWASS